jgi:hypothetical protein
MRRFCVLVALLSVTYVTSGQFPIDSVGFHIYRADIFHGEDSEDGFIENPAKRERLKVDALFYIESGIVTTAGMKDRLSRFRFLSDPVYLTELDGRIPGYYALTIDHGFYPCIFNVFQWDDRSYRIRIDYSNLRVYLYARITDERPEDRGIPDLVREAQSWRNNPDYTNQEIIEFYNKHIKGDEFSRIIIKGLIYETLTEF